MGRRGGAAPQGDMSQVQDTSPELQDQGGGGQGAPMAGPREARGALTLRGLQVLRDALGGHLHCPRAGLHPLVAASRLAEHMRGLQGRLALRSQVQVLLRQVRPQLPDLKLQDGEGRWVVGSTGPAMKSGCLALWGVGRSGPSTRRLDGAFLAHLPKALIAETFNVHGATSEGQCVPVSRP